MRCDAKILAMRILAAEILCDALPRCRNTSDAMPRCRPLRSGVLSKVQMLNLVLGGGGLFPSARPHDDSAPDGSRMSPARGALTGDADGPEPGPRPAEEASGPAPAPAKAAVRPRADGDPE